MQDIPFARPSIGDEEIEAVATVLRSGWLTTGAEALAFEKEFASFIGVRHALAVNSATAGLHLSLEATGVSPGTAVIVPSLTFTATAEVVRYLGAEVVFADILPDRLLLDPEDTARRAAAASKAGRPVAAIVPVHLAGEVCAIEPFREIAREHGAAIIEDAAHAFPSRTSAGYAGTLGTAGVFSFYANKTITTGEGGMVCTGDDALAGRIRTMRTHGIDRDAWDRYRSDLGGWYYQVVAPGFKYNMPDTAAAIGRVQLKRAESFLRRRRDAAEYYRVILTPLEERELITLPRGSTEHAWHLYVVRTSPSIDRDRVIRRLAQAGIGASVHYIPLHRMPYWSGRYGVTDKDLPRTAETADRVISLPMFPALTRSEQDRIAEVLESALREGS